MYPKSRFYRILDRAVPETTKKATKFGMRLFNGRCLLRFLEICEISNVTVENLRIYEDYITTTKFIVMLQNGLLVLVAPHFQNQ